MNVLQTDKREAILSMALEHGLVGFIKACISQWSTAGSILSSDISHSDILNNDGKLEYL